MSLAVQLKYYREKSGFSQNDVAKRLNISRQAISKWENDRGYPDIDNLVLLSHMYEVSIDELLKENEELKKKMKKNEEEISEKKRTLKFIKGKIEGKANDEGLVLLAISAVSAILFPLGFIIIPFILLRNKRTNTLYKLVYFVSICSLVINFFNLVDVSTDYFDIPWGETHIEKVE
jgi:transcriptional regulator with XRE-family HTH domain